MVKETREEKIRRIIGMTKEALAMTGEASSKHYSTVDLGVELDPDYYEVNAKSGWGFFKGKTRHLDPMTRQVIGSVVLAFRNRGGCYHHAKKALELGATMEQLLEAYAVASIPGGRPTAKAGLEALERIAKEQPELMAARRSIAPIPERKEIEEVIEPETREQRVSRIFRKIKDDGGIVDEALAFGVGLDPDYFEAYSQLAWGFFRKEHRHWDPVRREMFMLVIMAFRGMRNEVYLHAKKALQLGATMEQLLEAFETAVIPGGSLILMEGLCALKRIHDEQQAEVKKKQP